ncbi:TPA: response regulator transcription factor [Candidatus Poribacteria bacterium]|nr:response regulator transcription factor [Candidatus Poribacteria bacterium]
MKILITEDNLVTQRLLEATLEKYGYEVILSSNGEEAWEKYSSEKPPLAIIDWMIPKMDGLELCRRIRDSERQVGDEHCYIIILTGKTSTYDVVDGLDAGADDFMTKPFDKKVLLARIRAGERIIDLRQQLDKKNKELEKTIGRLEEALSKVKKLERLLPICSYCKKIRDEQDYWHQVEEYITQHSEAKFSHGICPDCYEKYVKPELKILDGSLKKRR